MYPFTPRAGGTVNITVSGSSSSASLSTGCTTALLTNSGSAICYVRIGTGAQTATTSDLPVLPGSAQTISISPANDTVAAISSSSTTLLVTPGTGI